MRLLTGTSGFGYKEWKGSFYPLDMPVSEMLTYYADRFGAVEINNTFYRMPAETVLQQWVEMVPDGFTFVLKAPQTISHRKRLKEVDDAVSHFFRVARSLAGHLGPVFVQLPPNFKKDLSRLETFLDLVPADARLTFEFRHPSWVEDDVLDTLRARNVALCIAQDEQQETPMHATADWGYVRLRRLDYDDSALEGWVRSIKAQAWSEVFVFFMHEDTGTGPRFARRFDEIFRDAGG